MTGAKNPYFPAPLETDAAFRQLGSSAFVGTALSSLV
jgi:hypothetical protein